MSWSEAEVKATIRAYFNLLELEQKGKKSNKSAIYRSLSARFPNRSTKAFELKFQNISAILYELHMPYCKGLKPRRNYQRLLKLLVLDHLDKSPLPPVEPFEILFTKLQDLHAYGPLQVSGEASGRFGLAIEKALGIPPNSKKSPDFMGIELKTKRSGGLQTLFSRIPSRYVEYEDKQRLFERYCYFSEGKKRYQLYTSFNNTPDKHGFRLSAAYDAVKVLRDRKIVLEYDTEYLEATLLSKLSSAAFLSVSWIGRKGNEACTIDSATYCKWPSIIRFLRLIEEGDVFLDFTMSKKNKGRVTDHGFLWRIRPNSLDTLYLSSKTLNLAAA